MKRTGTMKIKDILRHRHDLALPRAQIAAAVGVSTGTVSHVLARAEAAGLSWPLPDDLDDEALRARLYPAPGPDGDRVQPDWDAVIEALTAPRKRRRARLTRRQLWVEYRDEALAQGASPTPTAGSARCSANVWGAGRRRRRCASTTQPGLWGLSDFSGKTLGLRTGRGEKDVEIFVAVLAHSNLTYAEAVPDQGVRHWIMAHRRAFEYFGGVPSRWIIDNLKAGVDKPDREAPRLNPSFREFARHYGVAVLPARSGRATDKGLVEACVGAVQSRILLVLRHETFFSLDAMNAAIRRELDRLNEAPMACGETRRALFEAGERALLKPLPRNPWEWGEWIERKVGPNCHVRIARNHYSAPERHIGRKIHARVGERMVELFLDKGGERIAVHRLKSGRNQYATEPGHMPDRLNAVRDIREPDYGERARGIGPERGGLGRTMLRLARLPRTGLRHRAGDDPPRRRPRRRAPRRAVRRGPRPQPPRLRLPQGAHQARRRPRSAPPQARETIPGHDNIRGGDYYGNDGATP